MPASASSKRPSARQRGYNKRWEKAAKAYLERNPLCAKRGAPGCKVIARHVDHIEPHRGDRTKFWNKKNWQPLCHPCHSRKTLAEQRAEGTTRGADELGQPRDREHSWWR